MGLSDDLGKCIQKVEFDQRGYDLEKYISKTSRVIDIQNPASV
jgi:hypothetical protein